MPPVCRHLIDICTGHDCWPPRPTAGGSPNVKVNNKLWHRQTDPWQVHCCGSNCHSSVLASGSPTVIVNNLEGGRIGDPVACGSKVATGSPDTICGP